MARRRRRYKERINIMRYRLYKANQILDILEAALDFKHKPSYWNMRKLITRIKRVQRE